ncbi:MAG: GlmU protein [Deltaproteobacteria bacterium]|jgi:bifunctional UDP-N-acetylglucosamine pyrophosphorylase/glucosamine-1-phosphate N-acetyltransferase|nr:GlmU protein [Deltaproteobacteria bacterium]MDP7318339.1 sugar phosphate nucleotidyltransferase [SAR324 cluster bacterium]
MQVVILAASASQRLYPFTETRAKPMLWVGGDFVLSHTLHQLREAGVREVILVVNHCEAEIRNHFKSGTAWGVTIRYVVQPEIKGIGHALLCCQEHLNQKPFLLIYGDLLAVGDIYSPTLGRFTEFGEPVAVVTLPASSHEYGNIYFDHEMRINRLVEKPQQGQANYVLAGIFVLPHEFLRRLEKADQDILECFQDHIAQGQFHAQLWEKGWMDMVHPWHILEANKMILNQWATASIDTSAQLRGNVRIEGAVRIEGNVVIESGSVLKGPCLIGKGSYIGNNVLIRNHSVVGPKSLVGYGCELKNCIAFGGNDIGRLSFLGDSVLGEGTVLGAGVTTVNRVPDNSEIICNINGEETRTGLKKIGALIGDRAFIGARQTFRPNTTIPSGTIIPDNISY